MSPLLFVIYMIPQPRYSTKKSRIRLNHHLFMDDTKVIAKSEREVNGLVYTVPILCNNIGMEFEIRKCGVLEGK